MTIPSTALVGCEREGGDGERRLYSTGGFSLWGESADGAKQKELTGFKTYGVLLLARDPSAPLDDRVVAE